MIGMRREVLLDIGKFLLKLWSGRRDDSISFVIEDNEIPKTIFYSEKVVEVRVMPPSSNSYYDYRLWRWSVFHESMHVRFTPYKLDADVSIDYFLRELVNIVEDYRVEKKGLELFPGMKSEKMLSTAYYYVYYDKHYLPSIERVIDDESLKVDEIKVTLFMLRLLINRIPPSLMGYYRNYEGVIEEAVDYVTREVNRISSWEELKEVAEKVKSILRITTDMPIRTALDLEKLKRMMKIVSRGGRSLTMRRVDMEKDVVKLLEDLKVEKEVKEGSESIREEFRIVVELSKTMDRVEERTMEMFGEKNIDSITFDPTIKVPRKLDVDETKYYDVALISHLKAQLVKVRRGYLERYQHYGEEIDVDELARSSKKPFISEERLKIGGLKVLILLDFSGSMDVVEDDCKKLLIALGEALKFLGNKFAVFAFTSMYPKGMTSIYLVKSFEEDWGREQMKRLAQLEAHGATPIHHVYERLLNYVEREKPHVFLTITDGIPDRLGDTIEVIKKLKKKTRMVALAIGLHESDVLRLANNLKMLGYDRSIASQIYEIPKKILYILGEEAK